MRKNDELIGEPVTTDIPMLRDSIVYKFYLIRKDDDCSKSEIKAVAKLCNVNCIKAKSKLVDKVVFIAEGDAYRMKELKQAISSYGVIYEIRPWYPY